MKSHGDLDETVLISTVIASKRDDAPSNRQYQIAFPIALFRNGGLNSHIYLYEDVAAVRHLLGVTVGLDSMGLGGTEITGQIKNAYEIARAAGLTGRVLNRLFQKSFQATKEIRTRTGIGRGAVSIKSAAVELIGRILGDDFASRSIMVIGAGQMAECCVRLLVKKGARSILVSNRSFDRAIDLAMRYGGEAVCFGYCLFEMREVDVENLMQARRSSRCFGAMM